MKTSKPWRIVATIPAGSVALSDMTAMTTAVGELLRAMASNVSVTCEPCRETHSEDRITTAEAARRCRLTRGGWLLLAKRKGLASVDALDVGAGRVARTWSVSDVERIAKEREGVPRRVRRSPKRRK